MPKASGPAVCKDCRAESVRETALGPVIVLPKRPAPFPGPRCATHHRAQRKKRAQQQHATHLTRTFGAEPGWHERMLAFQNGRCFICQRATGAARRLAVDHDHKLEGTGMEGLLDMKRGLLCKPCNSMLAHARDDAEVFKRAAEYLLSPPAREMRFLEEN
jgi:hypothetical protein